MTQATTSTSLAACSIPLAMASEVTTCRSNTRSSESDASLPMRPIHCRISATFASSAGILSR